jgi:exonuclease III
MKLLSWNCQGLGNPWTVQDLCHLVKDKKPDILFLMETKCRKEKMEIIRVKLGFQGLFVVEPVGRSEGLALLWQDVQRLKIQNFTQRHINAIVTHGENGESLKLTCFYGHPVTAKRHESWALLEHLKQFRPQPWVCIGDFNEILTQGEKTGAVLRKERQMDQFREALEGCNLHDLGFTGAPFTWNNGRHDESFVKERLDRAVANMEWKAIFQEVRVFVLAARASDHKPLLLQYTEVVEGRQDYYRGFKFEAKWHLDEEYNSIMEEAWHEGTTGDTNLQTVQNKLVKCQNCLTRWSSAKYGNA